MLAPSGEMINLHITTGLTSTVESYESPRQAKIGFDSVQPPAQGLGGGNWQEAGCEKAWDEPRGLTALGSETKPAEPGDDSRGGNLVRPVA